MISQEMLYSFFIGIASGIISSVIVTQHYRKKDAEKDRQAFFHDVRMYVNSFITVDEKDIEAMYAFFSLNEFPKTFPWIRLNAAERKIIYELHQEVFSANDAVLEYRMTSYSEEMTQKQLDDLLKKRFLPQISSARVHILALTMDVNTLGDAEFAKEIERIRNELRTDDSK